MGNLFTGREIVELGIQIEKNGFEFYSAVAREENNSKAKKLFKFLAGEEEGHIEAFEGVLAGLDDSAPPESYPGEYGDYLQALAAAHIFTRENTGKEAATKVKGAKEAVTLAAGFEKDSILFYYEMKKIVAPNAQATVDELIRQEQEHLKKLSEIKKDL